MGKINSALKKIESQVLGFLNALKVLIFPFQEETFNLSHSKRTVPLVLLSLTEHTEEKLHHVDVFLNNVLRALPESLHGSHLHVGANGSKCRAPQDVPLWHVDYFELKKIKTQKTQEEPLNSPLTA